MPLKALVSPRPFGHERDYIQSTQTTHVTRLEILKINWTTEPVGWVSGLHDIEENFDTAYLPLLTLIE